MLSTQSGANFEMMGRLIELGGRGLAFTDRASMFCSVESGLQLALSRMLSPSGERSWKATCRYTTMGSLHEIDTSLATLASSGFLKHSQTSKRTPREHRSPFLNCV